MLSTRMRAGLLGLGLTGLAALPAAAQNWPSDSGPTGDYLGSTVRQFDRLDPPTIEAGGRRERVVPNMPVTDVPADSAFSRPVPEGSVDVGVPVVVSVPLPPPARAAARPSASPAPSDRRARSASTGQEGWEARLMRELELRDRRIEALERQIQEDRQRAAASGTRPR